VEKTGSGGNPEVEKTGCGEKTGSGKNQNIRFMNKVPK
jgi:hypothetical protein